MGDDQKSPIIPISGIAVMLAAIGFSLFTQTPFKLGRPYVPEPGDARQSNKVAARLWQDPFRAVEDHRKKLKEKKKAAESDLGIGNLKGQIDGLLGEIRPPGTLTILGVMVPGGAYSEETENRTRQRYAALSGLGRLGFIPRDQEHVEYIVPALRDSSGRNVQTVLPYEWFRRPDDTADDRVLLLWIDDNAFQQNPLSMLNRFFDAVTPEEDKAKGRIAVKIIGPATSATLKAMVREAADMQTSFDALKNLNTEIYSAMATMDDTALWKGPFNREAGDIARLFGNLGMRFERTIGSDHELARMLIDELKLRNVDLGNRKNHMILISEWDTEYGRSWKEAFRSNLQKRDIPWDAIDRQVHYFSYMRGIDGSLPGEKEEKKSEKAENKGKDSDSVKQLEQPVGKHQFDYLRRLADEMYRFEERLSDGEIRAIGVLGNDFYDKYLALQALRPRFPQTVFFTTDLDARLIHPDHLKATRNVVVASNFGFSLRKDTTLDIQGAVPPFRDNYQTSLFYTILYAFAGRQYLLPADNAAIEKAPRPRPLIFEIGLNGAVQLNDWPEDKNSQQNKPGLWGYYRTMGKAFLVLALATLLLCLVNRRFCKAVRDLLGVLKKHPVITMAVIAGAAMTTFILINHQSTEEPLSLFDGVSVWPTELIRCLAIGCSLYFIARARKEIGQNSDWMAGAFCFQDPSKGPDPPAPWKDWDDAFKTWLKKPWLLTSVCSVFKGYWQTLRNEWGGDLKNRDMEYLWNYYMAVDGKRARRLRLIPIFVIYFFLSFAIIRFWGAPFRPIRGSFSYFIDFVILLVSVLTMVYLILYVFDVTMVCKRFILFIRDNRPEWPQEHFQGILGQGSGSPQQRNHTDDSPSRADPWKEWLWVRLIAWRTEAVGRLIFYPCIVWFIMFISRHQYFDNWQTNLGLAIVVTMGAVFAWSCAYSLRRTAEDFRTDALRRLRNQQIALKYRSPSEDLKPFDLLKNEIRDLKEGAFASFAQHPVVRALYLPFGGVGSLYLIDFISKMSH